MRRYWIEAANISGPEVLFEGDLYHHIFKVCRMQEGSRFEALVDGRAYFVEVVEVQKRQARARILEQREIPPLPSPKIHLYLALSKWATMDNVVEKSVELGVEKITPFFSDYSFISSKNKLSSAKIERWNKIVVSATQQCGRGELLEVTEATEFGRLVEDINRKPGCLGLFFYEGEGGKPLSQHLSMVNKSDYDEIAIIVGSEGGFSDQEKDILAKNQLPPLTLGPQILRVETACVALISIIKYEMILK